MAAPRIRALFEPGKPAHARARAREQANELELP